MIDPSLLDQVPILADASPRAREELARRAMLRAVAPGEVLWHAGTEARGLFVLLEGEVRVVRSRGGRQHVIHTEGPGGTLGEIPLFAGGVYPATAIAARRSLGVMITREGIEAAIQCDPRFAFSLLARLAQRVRGLIERLDGLATQDVTARLAEFLLRRHQESRAPSFALGRSQAEVAEELGTVREVVVRALRALRESGVIRAAGNGRYVVDDVEALRTIALG